MGQSYSNRQLEKAKLIWEDSAFCSFCSDSCPTEPQRKKGIQAGMKKHPQKLKGFSHTYKAINTPCHWRGDLWVLGAVRDKRFWWKNAEKKNCKNTLSSLLLMQLPHQQSQVLSGIWRWFHITWPLNARFHHFQMKRKIKLSYWPCSFRRHWAIKTLHAKLVLDLCFPHLFLSSVLSPLMTGFLPSHWVFMLGFPLTVSLCPSCGFNFVFCNFACKSITESLDMFKKKEKKKEEYSAAEAMQNILNCP